MLHSFLSHLHPLAREPLVQFLLAGGLIFILASLLASGGAGQTIVVDDRLRQQLSSRWQAQMGRPPSPAELLSLVDQHLTEELYYREALALGLDQGDLIVRRRLVQKLRFLTEDLATLAPVAEEELRAFYAAGRENYRTPVRLTFEQRLFAKDQHESAFEAATLALESAKDNTAPRGDASLLPGSLIDQPLGRVESLFGVDFAGSLLRLARSDAWQGPIESAYGWHLLRLSRMVPAEVPPFESVADQVRSQLDRQRRDQANAELLKELRQNYKVEWRAANNGGS